MAWRSGVLAGRWVKPAAARLSSFCETCSCWVAQAPMASTLASSRILEQLGIIGMDLLSGCTRVFGVQRVDRINVRRRLAARIKFDGEPGIDDRLRHFR